MDKSSFQGQPLQHHKLATDHQPTDNCSICNKPNDSKFIKCLKCCKSFHLCCAERENSNQTFICSNCFRENQVPDSPKSVCSHRSNASNSSMRSIVRRRNLELQRLEEERHLAMERDSQFLKQKYQLLQQTEEEIDDNDVAVSSVHEWLNSQPDPSLNMANDVPSDPPNICEASYFPLPANYHSAHEPRTSIENNLVFTTTTTQNAQGCMPKNPIVNLQNLSETTYFNLPTTNSSKPTTSRQSNLVLTTTNQIPRTTPIIQSNTPIDSLQSNFQINTPNVSLNSTSFNNTTTFINSTNVHPAAAAQTRVHLQTPADTFLPSFSIAPRNSTNHNLTYQQINARQTVPKDLPTFTGNPEEWPLFSSTYDWSTTVCGLTDAENLVRLQKALHGDALQAVQHILIHPFCVPAAISTLKLLYGQPEKILHSLKTKIRSLPTINPNKLDTITSFAVQVKGLQATIEACGMFDELNNSSLLQELVSKLPSYFQINWGTYKINLSKQNKKVNLSEFSDWIFEIGVSASSVNIECSIPSAAEFLSRNKQKNVYIHTHTEQEKKCLICGGNCNNVANCLKFKEAERTEKWNMVREFKLCKQCLRKHFGICNSNNVCGVDNCQIKHHSLLHKMNEEIDKREMSTITNQPQNCNTHSVSSCTNLFKIIPITIYGSNGKSVNTFAFIDDGSSTSLIDEQIIKDLDLIGSIEPLCLKWTGSVERKEEDSRRLCINISGPNKKIHSIDVRTVKLLSLSKQTIDMEKMRNDFPYLKGLPLKGYTDAAPSLIIGLNNSRLCVYNNIREGKTNEPTAIRTRLGWVVYGSMTQNSLVEHHHCHTHECSNEKLCDLMKKFYSLETFGINNKCPIGKDEERAMSILQKYTKQRPDGHYETSLLWQNEEKEMPTSYDMALGRFLCLEKKLKNDSTLNDICNTIICEYISKGYISKIGNINLSSKTDGKVWYLPIFPVFNKNKPGKTRLVWDAAAKSKGVSLNSLLLKGPDLLCSLPSILIRFRQKSVAICGDIEQMFHQIFIRKEDRNVQRFLWHNTHSEEPDIFAMNVMIFGASCSPCTSQYVKNINADKFYERYPVAATAIKQNHYVDDFLDSVDTPEEAICLALDVKLIHSKGGFNIRNWLCNDNNVLSALNEKENYEQKNLNLGSDTDANKVLGIFWKSSEDLLTFKLSSYILSNDLFLGTKTPTKRELLKVLMTIYDPLGLIGHYLMYLKVVLQEVWRSGIGWDEKIQPLQKIKWEKWLSFLPEIQNIVIPRCYLQTFKTYENLDIQLHTFSDASENGYAAVSYLRISSGDNIVVSLIGSKTRVSPLRVTSIPRLELMGAVIASRFANHIVNSTTISIKQKVFWCDSRTVISWLRSEHRKYHQFVAFRISEILDTTELSEWRWIPGRFNVADEATKWSKRGPDLSSTSRWQNGPDFLMQDSNSWYRDDNLMYDTDCELKQHIHYTEKSDYFINIKRFSKWNRAFRAVAYVIHYVNKLKRIKTQSNLSQTELKKAEIVLIKQAQNEEYLSEIKDLKSEGKISKNSSIYKLSAYLDSDGTLRIDSRVDYANLSTDFEQPAIMPKYSYITELLILNFHEQYHHVNHETAINEIRQKYYVPRLRSVYRKIIRKCQMCKIKTVQPIIPQMAKLPRARLSAYAAPFTFTGLDFFGPILVNVNRHKEKRYGAIFTCLTIRAVHIEIVHSLNTTSCILAIRNFMARRGTPREFYSDNGTNFIGAERELRETIKEIDSNEFVRKFTTSITRWNFNPPAAPHMGGAWERMVRSVKTVLYKIMPDRSPNDETLRSMMTEVENIINSRPLTYVPINDETQEALTPNHLLLGCSNGMKPLVEYNDGGLVVKNSWLYSQQYAQQFWKRWLTEYLPTLTCRTKWFEKSKPISVGDLVVVVDPLSPRNVWPRGKILETRVAKDGQVRSAKVMTACGVLERPVAKLAVLDVAQNKE